MIDLYAIGPITGIENNNRVEFERVRKLLERYTVIRSSRTPESKGARIYSVRVWIPHDFVDERSSWECCMMQSINQITRTHLTEDDDDNQFIAPWYDGIAMLDGWGESRGACLEYDIADTLGIPCKPWREWLELLQ